MRSYEKRERKEREKMRKSLDTITLRTNNRVINLIVCVYCNSSC